MAGVTLIREDDETVALTLDGIATIQEVHDGRITVRPVSDLSPQSDGVIVDAIRLSLEGTLPTTSVSDGAPTGEARVDDTRDRLQALQASGARVTLYVEGMSGIGSLGVERFRLTRRAADDPDLSIDLVERRTGRRRTVALLPPPLPAAPKGPPRPDVADALTPTVEQGPTPTVPLQSRAAAGADYALGVLRGG